MRLHVDAKFPRVLTEAAVEPDDRCAGRVRHALDDLTFAHGALPGQVRSS